MEKLLHELESKRTKIIFDSAKEGIILKTKDALAERFKSTVSTPESLHRTVSKGMQ
jgi:hypothetical protein